MISTVDEEGNRKKEYEHIMPLYSSGRRTYNEAKYYYESKGEQNTPEVRKYLENLKQLEEIEERIESEKDPKIIKNLKGRRKILKRLIAPMDEKHRKTMTPGSHLWDMRMDTKFQKESNDRSVRVIAAPSGTTRELMTVAKEFGADKNLLEAFRLSCLGFFIPEKHHSFHEIMMVSKAFGLNYTDSDERYAHIAPLTEKELRDKVAKYKKYPHCKGKFPHEIGKSLSKVYRKKK